MKHRIRIIKYCFHDKDSTEFSLETTVDENFEELSKALRDAFGSLRSFNAEMAKQGDAKTPIFQGKTSIEGKKVSDDDKVTVFVEDSNSTKEVKFDAGCSDGEIMKAVKEVSVKRGETSDVIEQGTLVKLEEKDNK